MDASEITGNVMSEQAQPIEEMLTAADLARIMGYSVSTITAMHSKHPERLPPRARGVHKLRWWPADVREWRLKPTIQPAAEAAPQKPKSKRGRPRVR